jgi:hypothetical protein
VFPCSRCANDLEHQGRSLLRDTENTGSKKYLAKRASFRLTGANRDEGG